MPPRDVDADRIGELSRRFGLGLDDEERDDFAALVDDAVTAVDEYDPPTFTALEPVKADRSNPRPGSDDSNVWITRCTVDAGAGPLDDLDVGLKDNIALAGVPMTCGSTLLSEFVSEIDAPIAARLLEAGATIVGKTNMESFAWSGSSDCSDYGTVPNPHDETRLSGGSSSGSAAAVALGDCDATIGGDQGGSIRIPAAWCGVVGLKPTHGLVPYTGAVPLDPTIDHAGPLAGDVETAARVLTAIAGEHRVDGIRLDPRQPRGVRGDDYATDLDADPSSFTIGVLEEGFDWEASDAAVDRTVRDAIDRLDTAGVTVESVSIPEHRDSLSLIAALETQGGYRTVLETGEPTHRDGWYWPAFARALREALADRADELPDTTTQALLTGAQLEDTRGVVPYGRAKNAVLHLRREYDHALDRYDALVMPTVPIPPFERDPTLDRRARLGRIVANHRNTATFDHTHHPALSVPCGTADGLPVGLQLVGERFDERTLFELGRCVERTAG